MDEYTKNIYRQHHNLLEWLAIDIHAYVQLAQSSNFILLVQFECIA